VLTTQPAGQDPSQENRMDSLISGNYLENDKNLTFYHAESGRRYSASKLDISGPRTERNIIFVFSILKLFTLAKQVCKKPQMSNLTIFLPGFH
jgi:hypothetical protein